MKKAILILILFLLLFSCDKTNQRKESSGSGLLGIIDMDGVYDIAEESIQYSKKVPHTTATSSENESIAQRIIKTSNLSFETPSVEKTYQHIASLLKVRNGFIQTDNTTKDYGRISRSLIVRIPTNQFQPVIDSIVKKVKVFDFKNTSLRDVTEEFIDLEARLKAKKTLENRYLQLLSKAKTVKEMLEIEREIAKIREEIEAKQGRLKYLQNKVSFSTINLEFYEYTEVVKSESKTYFSRVGKAISGGFHSLGEFILGLLYIWPFVLIFGVLIYFVRKWIKKRK
jgi:hypothetical protein